MERKNGKSRHPSSKAPLPPAATGRRIEWPSFVVALLTLFVGTLGTWAGWEALPWFHCQFHKTAAVCVASDPTVPSEPGRPDTPFDLHSPSPNNKAPIQNISPQMLVPEAIYNCQMKDGNAPNEIAGLLRTSIDDTFMPRTKTTDGNLVSGAGFIVQTLGVDNIISISTNPRNANGVIIHLTYGGRREIKDDVISRDASANAADRSAAIIRNAIRNLATNRACVDTSQFQSPLN